MKLAVEELMSIYDVPGVSMAFMNDAKTSETKTFGVLQSGKKNPVDNETMFSVASISKVITAMLVLKFVDEGKIDLDRNVNDYLTSWKVQENESTKNGPVTIRHILSHTAGLSVHGFADYYPGETLPTTLQTLRGEKPAKNKEVRLILPIGEQFKYSGGGTTIIQMMMEDLTGLPFHEVAHQTLFKPLELKRTSFKNPLPGAYGNIAKAHNRNGKPVALPRGHQAMPEVAASGLWTTPSELMVLLSSLMQARQKENSEFLSAHLVEDMITPENQSEHGLGPKIEHRNNDRVVLHGGSNESYKAKFGLFWRKQKGYIVFTNGSNGSRLIKELEPLIELYLNL